jgi:hypothetical protein
MISRNYPCKYSTPSRPWPVSIKAACRLWAMKKIEIALLVCTDIILFVLAKTFYRQQASGNTSSLPVHQRF